ncbi:hypothetical protein LGH83_05475 [Lichenihabitans sp. PAMC28606]|uniref:alpha/beta fold hydrolase n=1 Tax=Lichenihabitans sp. PAMC28606 TaxID=2880932 RepID=UPI001D0B8672|nr:hypothetical protein [Lichenihabitans sp. PAMC28606]UDL95664.1 hypothetical protein LGH83_05475 [Lichenihabitans sp. PAMC28606]
MPPLPNTFVWIDQAQRLELSIERRGQGPTLLMLPALSSISTLGEMQPLQDRLTDHFQTVALDWPGFGTRPRPLRIWDRKAMQTYLDVVLDTVVQAPLRHSQQAMRRAICSMPLCAGPALQADWFCWRPPGVARCRP